MLQKCFQGFRERGKSPQVCEGEAEERQRCSPGVGAHRGHVPGSQASGSPGTVGAVWLNPLPDRGRVDASPTTGEGCCGVPGCPFTPGTATKAGDNHRPRDQALLRGSPTHPRAKQGRELLTLTPLPSGTRRGHSRSLGSPCPPSPGTPVSRPHSPGGGSPAPAPAPLPARRRRSPAPPRPLHAGACGPPPARNLCPSPGNQ